MPCTENCRTCSQEKCVGLSRPNFHLLQCFNVGRITFSLTHIFCGNLPQVIQRRTNGAEDFNQLWADYKNGFGSLNEEFWIGNEAIHYITTQESYSLRIDGVDWDDNLYSATYEKFHTGTETEWYKLNLSGTASGNLSKEIHVLTALSRFAYA